MLCLAACTQAQLQDAETKAASYQQAIGLACATAMGLAPLAGPVAPWIIGGCATEAAIAKLALDPSSLAWINSLIAKAKSGGRL